MEMNQFNINYRIFKKERVKNNDRSLLIVPKQKEVGTFNQLELSWNNEFLEKTYISIVGRVTVKEWERILGAYPINRAFVQIKEDSSIKFFITFKVSEELSGTEIRNIIFTATNILNECLEKVTKKIVGEQVLGSYLNELENIEEVPTHAVTPSLNYEERLREQDNLIRKMTLEVEQQESFLNSLNDMEKSIDSGMISNEKSLLSDISILQKKIATYEKQFKAIKVKEQRLMEENNQLREVNGYQALEYEAKIKDTANAVFEKENQIKKLNKEIKDYVRTVQALTTKDNINAEMNSQLDKANLKLNEMLKQNKLDTNRLGQMSKIESNFKEVFKEKLILKTQLADSQRMVKQYENTNNRLNESLEKIQSNQEVLVGKAREEHDYLEDCLRETETKIQLEKNEYQKIVIELKEVNKKLEVEKIDINK